MKINLNVFDISIPSRNVRGTLHLFCLIFYTDDSKTGQRAKITLVVISTVLFAVFVAFCALLGTYLGSLRQGKIIHKMTCIISSE